MYISDPAKPVPFVRRPMQAMGYEEGNVWPRWRGEDRSAKASGRPDVVAFLSDVLKEPLWISGEPIANLIASIERVPTPIASSSCSTAYPRRGRR